MPAARSDASAGTWPLTLLFWSLALALSWLGAFPMDDDWAYGEPVRRWLAGEGLRLSDWGSPTLLAHLAWGALFCLPRGHSPGALRLSTLALSWLAVLAFHQLLLRLGASRRAALAGALALLFNPLYFLLSFSFMTDVPALSWMLLASLGFLRGWQERRPGLVWAASAAAAVAYLVRQTGLCVPAAVCLWQAARGERSWRAYVRVAALPAAALALHALWAMGEPAAPEASLRAGVLAHLSQPGIASITLGRAAGAVLFVAAFVSPLAPCALAGVRDALKRGWGLAAAFAAAAAWVLSLGRLPVEPSIVGTTGLGVCSLAACHLKAAGPFASPWLWALFAALAGLSLLAVAPRLAERRWREPAAVLAGGGFALAFLVSLAHWVFYDRYLLVLLPPAIAVAALAAPVTWPRAAPGLALAACISVLGTWDYLAWTAAKWEAGRRFLSQGLEPEEIYAGLEWSGVHGFSKRAVEAWPRSERLRAYVSFAPAVSSGRLARVGEVPYFSPLTARRERVYLWRDPAPSKGSQEYRPKDLVD
ncbi:MAG: glycosyltransferase family 39 protein [Elusimicrobia bacterium]|nr:glycosyltransferase family 39 protein [Elusimicrobiota bacterium]